MLSTEQSYPGKSKLLNAHETPGTENVHEIWARLDTFYFLADRQISTSMEFVRGWTSQVSPGTINKK